MSDSTSSESDSAVASTADRSSVVEVVDDSLAGDTDVHEFEGGTAVDVGVVVGACTVELGLMKS